MDELKAIENFVSDFGIKGEYFNELVILMNDMYLSLKEKEKGLKIVK